MCLGSGSHLEPSDSSESPSGDTFFTLNVRPRKWRCRPPLTAQSARRKEPLLNSEQTSQSNEGSSKKKSKGVGFVLALILALYGTPWTISCGGQRSAHKLPVSPNPPPALEAPEFPAWPEDVEPPGAGPLTLEQEEVMSGILGELMIIPGPDGECALRMMQSRHEMLDWGKRVWKVEQARCEFKAEAAKADAETLPWWGIGVLGAGAGVAGIVLGVVFGFIAGGGR